jgi:hypothetical protein
MNQCFMINGNPIKAQVEHRKGRFTAERGIRTAMMTIDPGIGRDGSAPALPVIGVELAIGRGYPQPLRIFP